MDNLLDVAVCIMSYNRPCYLSGAIESVLSQKKKPVEIIVFDNGSGKEVEDTVKRYFDKGVVFEGSDVHRTAEWNFMRALNGASAGYINIMHDDDRMCPDFLDKQVGYLERHPDVLGIYCNCYLIDSLGARKGRLKPYAGNRKFNSGSKVAYVYGRGSCLPFPTGVYRADEARKVPGRREYGKVADVVFMCDLADRGAIAYQSLPLYEYRMHCEQDSASISQELLSTLDEFLFSRINEKAQFSKKIQWYASRSLRRIFGG